MDYLAVCLAALAASGLTLFSGFGLGTLVMPVFALFFPVEVAVAQTALVHFANNIFKLGLFWRHADWKTVLLFGGPAFAAGLFGAGALLWLADLPAAGSWGLGGRSFRLEWVKLVIGCLMVVFAVLEVRGTRPGAGLPRRWIPAGGLLSGFFGGLSVHQGAFRSAFLIRSGLSKEAFIATGVVIAVLVDFSRLAIYAGLIGAPEVRARLGLVVAATMAAFAGALLAGGCCRR
jgi:uncharacterized membrane protein YfcA